VSFKSGLKVERESQFNTAGGSEFQVGAAAVLNDRLANDVRRNGTHSSGTDDDRVLRALVNLRHLRVNISHNNNRSCMHCYK